MRVSFQLNPAMRRELRPGDRRLWLLWSVALRIEKSTRPVWRFEVYHRRLLAALGVLAIAGYLVATTALWAWLGQNPHNQARWTDVVQLAWRWDELRRRRGDTAVATARAQLEQGDYIGAYHHLRVGIGRSPANHEGRLLLARILAGHEPARALAVLEEGVEHSASELSFVATLFAFYSEFETHRRALDRADELLARGDAIPADVRDLVQRARAGLLSRLGRAEEAVEAMARVPAPGDPAAAVRHLLAQVDLMLRAGRPGEARRILQENPGLGIGTADRLRREGDVAVALGDADALQSVLRRWRALSPEEPLPYLFAFNAWHRLNRASFRDAAEAEYYRLFARNDAAMQSYAALLVNLGLPDNIERARHVAMANRLSPFAFRVHSTEAALRRGETEQAVRLLRDWEYTIETLAPRQRFYPEFIKRLARAAFSGEEGPVDALSSHLVSHRVRAQLPIWLLALNTLELARQPAAAARLLRSAIVLYPHTDPILAMRARVEAATATSAAEAEATRAASAAPAIPPGASETIARIDAHLAAEELAAARDLLRAVNAARPGWLVSHERQVGVREIQLSLLTLDPLSTRARVRSFLDRWRDEETGLELAAIADRFIKSGRLDEARILAGELIAASPPAGRVQAVVRALDLPDDLASHTATAVAAIGALDRWISSGQWTQAERLLQALAEKPPPWVADSGTDLKVREVQVRLGLDQRPAAFTALRELVLRPGAPRSAAFKLARDYISAGDRDSAVTIALEIRRLLPEEPAAAKLVDEARTPAPVDP